MEFLGFPFRIRLGNEILMGRLKSNNIEQLVGGNAVTSSKLRGRERRKGWESCIASRYQFPFLWRWDSQPSQFHLAFPSRERYKEGFSIIYNTVNWREVLAAKPYEKRFFIIIIFFFLRDGFFYFLILEVIFFNIIFRIFYTLIFYVIDMIT